MHQESCKKTKYHENQDKEQLDQEWPFNSEFIGDLPDGHDRDLVELEADDNDHCNWKHQE
jgi:hypothetical protein